MIYHKTPLGQQAFKERSAALTHQMRTAFLLFDGVRDVASVLTATQGLGCTASDVQNLLDLAFIEVPAGTKPAAPIELDEHNVPYPTVSSQERYMQAAQLATALTSKLGLFGFRLNLAVESAANLDELRALLPKIEEACGHDAIYSLARVLHE